MTYEHFKARYRAGEWRARIFRDMIIQDIRRISDPAVVLDIGCGGGFDGDQGLQEELAAAAGTYIGIEPDPEVTRPRCVNEFHNCIFENAPIEPESVDVAFCVMVMEHLQHPDLFWAQLARVLKPNGIFWGFTVDSRHLFCLASRWMQFLGIKDWYLDTLHGKRGVDRYLNYPVYYRMNAPRHFHGLVSDDGRFDFINLSRVGQLNHYVPSALRPVTNLFDRLGMMVGRPGYLCAVRWQPGSKPAKNPA